MKTENVVRVVAQLTLELVAPEACGYELVGQNCFETEDLDSRNKSAHGLALYKGQNWLVATNRTRRSRNGLNTLQKLAGKEKVRDVVSSGLYPRPYFL